MRVDFETPASSRRRWSSACRRATTSGQSRRRGLERSSARTSTPRTPTSGAPGVSSPGWKRRPAAGRRPQMSQQVRGRARDLDVLRVALTGERGAARLPRGGNRAGSFFAFARHSRTSGIDDEPRVTPLGLSSLFEDPAERALILQRQPAQDKRIRDAEQERVRADGECERRDRNQAVAGGGPDGGVRTPDEDRARRWTCRISCVAVGGPRCTVCRTWATGVRSTVTTCRATLQRRPPGADSGPGRRSGGWKFSRCA